MRSSVDGAGLVLIGLLAVITLWQPVGTWRSANNNSRKTGRWFWPGVVKMLAAFNLLGATFRIGTNGSDQVSILGALDDPELTAYRIERRGDSDLVLSGAINETSAREVISALKDPSIGILWITGQGGLIDAAHRLGRHIRGNEVMVMADGECVFACVMVIAASSNAAIFLGAMVMFHRVEPLFELANPELRHREALSLREAREIYRELGIADWGIETAGRQQFWTPTFDSMIRMNLIDLIYNPARERFVPAVGYCMGYQARCGNFKTPPAPHRSS